MKTIQVVLKRIILVSVSMLIIILIIAASIAISLWIAKHVFLVMLY
jgi:hypothetical protein